METTQPIKTTQLIFEFRDTTVYETFLTYKTTRIDYNKVCGISINVDPATGEVLGENNEIELILYYSKTDLTNIYPNDISFFYLATPKSFEGNSIVYVTNAIKLWEILSYLTYSQRMSRYLGTLKSVGFFELKTPDFLSLKTAKIYNDGEIQLSNGKVFNLISGFYNCSLDVSVKRNTLDIFKIPKRKKSSNRVFLFISWMLNSAIFTMDITYNFDIVEVIINHVMTTGQILPEENPHTSKFRKN